MNSPCVTSTVVAFGTVPPPSAFIATAAPATSTTITAATASARLDLRKDRRLMRLLDGRGRGRVAGDDDAFLEAARDVRLVRAHGADRDVLPLQTSAALHHDVRLLALEHDRVARDHECAGRPLELDVERRGQVRHQ